MKTYSEFRPTQFDAKGLGLTDRQNWLVLPCGLNRDADVVTESNFVCAKKSLEDATSEVQETDTFEVHRFGHWGPGWFDLILVKPDTRAAEVARDIEAALENYPILSDDDLSERAEAEALSQWSQLRPKERIEYVRRHYDEHSFQNFADLLGCIRGKHFNGDALGLATSH